MGFLNLPLLASSLMAAVRVQRFTWNKSYSEPLMGSKQKYSLFEAVKQNHHFFATFPLWHGWQDFGVQQVQNIDTECKGQTDLASGCL